MNEATPTNVDDPRLNRPLTLMLASLLLVTPMSGRAQDRHGAHEHGVGRLNVAAEGQTLEMELFAPGADIVGFEHAAGTAQEQAAVTAAVARLKAGGTLFTFPAAAGCTLADAGVESALLADDAAAGHRHEKKDPHGHTNEHGHKGEHAHAPEGHAEFHVHYHFDCTDLDALTYIDTTYFDAFPAARELVVQALTNRGQTARELTPANPRLDL